MIDKTKRGYRRDDSDEDEDFPLARINTVLHADWSNEDHPPLQLSIVQGAEGVSVPYAYEVTLLRHDSIEDIDPSELIGTPCAISLRNFHEYEIGLPGGPSYVVRKGVFEHFESLRIGKITHHRVYRGRVVPAFSLLTKQTRYRIFEDRTVREIIWESLSKTPYLELDLTRLDYMKEFGGIVPYSVQLGESTFAFVSRVMAQYGLWYYFDHGTDATILEGSKMVIGSVEDPRWDPDYAMHMAVSIDKEEPSGNEGKANLYNFKSRYHSVPHRVFVGNFNPLKPAAPFEGTRPVDEEYRLVREGAVAAVFEETEFPEPLSSGDEGEQDAANWMQRREAAVYQVSAGSDNTTFMAGRKFLIAADATIDSPKDEDKRNALIFGEGNKPIYLIVKLDFVAIVGDIGWGFWNTVGGFFSGLVSGLFESGGSDATAGTIVSILKKAYGSSVPGGTSFRSTLVAVPWCRGSIYERIPQVEAQRPVARGPQLAQVIGPQGIAPESGSDVYADALGRIRIRFPWEPGVFAEGDRSSEGRWSSGENTCWVRVAHQWAGKGFGTQFLPRIGQQVLVDYIDGDPERPVVVGGVYSAKNGWTELPFPRGASAEEVHMQDWLGPQGGHGFPRSGIKTRSIPDSRHENRFHLIRLDDSEGSEQFVIRSQGRLDVTSFGNHYETTLGDRHTVVSGEGDGATGGNWVADVGAEYDLKIGHSRLEEVGEDYQLNVKRDTNLLLEGNLTVGVGKGASISGGTITLSASQNITLKVGGSFVVLTPGGIYINGPMVYINSGGGANDAGAVALRELQDAQRADPGDK